MTKTHVLKTQRIKEKWRKEIKEIKFWKVQEDESVIKWEESRGDSKE